MNHRVIVVEDEELISTMIKVNLKREGYDVMHFGDAESMLDHIRSNTDCCDIVLLDIMLPGMNGDEAIVELRKLNFKAPVIMLTAKRDIETRVDVLNKGADDYLAKPFNVDELIARVNALIRRYQN
jgi:DNA-binding response OmpR family regulator